MEEAREETAALRRQNMIVVREAASWCLLHNIVQIEGSTWFKQISSIRAPAVKHAVERRLSIVSGRYQHVEHLQLNMLQRGGNNEKYQECI